MDNYLLPERLYRLIPVIYVALGVCIWIKLDTVYALISGAMMVGAGILVLLIRRSADYQRLRVRMRKQEIKRCHMDDDYADTLTLTLQ